MKNFLEIVKHKIEKKFIIEKINILDNSKKHSKHKFFDKNKYHLYLEIESKYLRSIDKIKAHREIMNVLKMELKTKIHALEIKIR